LTLSLEHIMAIKIPQGLGKIFRKSPARRVHPGFSVSDPFPIFYDKDYYTTFPSLVRVGEKTLMAMRIAPAEPFNVPTRTQPQQHLHPRSFLAIGQLEEDYRLADFHLFPSDVHAADQDPNFNQLSNGDILLSSFSWRPVLQTGDGPQNCYVVPEKTSGQSSVFWGSFTSLSSDQGKTWNKRTYLAPVPGYPDIVQGHRLWHGGRQRGQTIELPNGDLLMGTYDRVPNTTAFSSYLFRSKDRGMSWQFDGTIATDTAGKAGYAEPTLVLCETGDILALHRTFGCNDRLAVCRSNDGGRSWSEPELQAVIGHPFHVVTMPAGPHLLLYGVRHEPCSICFRFLSRENGDIAAAEHPLKSGGISKDIGYPTGIAIDQKTVLVAYYWTDSSAVRYIEGVTIRFNELTSQSQNTE